MNLDMQERAVALFRSALGMDRHGKAACQARCEGGYGGPAGRDARFDIVTVEMQDERLVGRPAQLDALALGGAQHALRRRHAALRDVKLERPNSGSRAFVAGDDRLCKARAERDDCRDYPCCRHWVIVA